MPGICGSAGILPAGGRDGRAPKCVNALPSAGLRELRFLEKIGIGVGGVRQQIQFVRNQKPMATSALGVQARPGSSWIISDRTDLLWFTVGGAAAGYAFWALWRYSQVPLLLLVAIWAVVFDETHGFATISRTYFDAQERARRGRWLWASLAFFVALGPVLILLHLGEWLEFLTILWGYFHIYRQHYGFMMMYKKKNHDFAKEDMRLDKIFFTAAFYYPFLTFPLHSKEAAELVPFPILPRVASI